MKVKHDINFTGIEDSDTNPRALRTGDFLLLENGDAGVSPTGNTFVVENVLGNTLQTFRYGGLGAGTNKVVGSLSDVRTKTIFYWVWNSTGQHRIIVYRKELAALDMIANGAFLGLTENGYITSPELIGDILYWVDGSSPKQINVARAAVYGKQQQVRFCFGGLLRGWQGVITIVFDNINSSIPGTITFPYTKNIDTTAWTPTSYSDLIRLIYNELTGDGGLIEVFNFYNQGDHILVESQATLDVIDTWGFTLSFVANASNVDPVQLRPYFLYENTYALPMQAASIERIKAPALTAPRFSFGREERQGANNIFGRAFQFRTRYYYYDNEPTVLSTISALTIDNDAIQNQVNAQQPNVIYVDYTDPYLTGVGRHNIKSVDIIFREGNDANWRVLASMSIAEIGGVIPFYNDGFYAAVSQAESTIPYHPIPLKSRNQAFIKGRGMLSCDEEGYDPIATNIELSTIKPVVSGVTNSNTFSLTGSIVVVNALTGSDILKYSDLDGVPYMGKIPMPLGGLVVYLAGTNFSTIATPRVAGNALVLDFEFINIPSGTYILRIASHLLTFNYNGIFTYSENSLDYQKTSTFVVQAGGVNSARELVVTLDENVALGNNAFRIVAPPVNTDYDMCCGYLYDTFMVAPTADLLCSSQVNVIEKAVIDFKRAGTLGAFFFDANIATTDYNGFYFYFYSGIPGSGLLSGLDTITCWGTKTGTQIYKYSDEGTWTGLPALPSFLRFETSSSGDPIPNNNFGYSQDYGGFEASNSWRNLVISQSVDTMANNIGTVKGKVTDQNGSPIKNVLVQWSNTGRWSFTNEQGDYELKVYGTNSTGNTRFFDGIVVAYFGSLEMNNPGNDFSITNIISFESPSIINFNRTILLFSKRSMPKAGGRYGIAVCYYDESGRFPGAMTDGNNFVSIPISTETPTRLVDFYYVRARIRHLAPSWAKKYQIVRTVELNAISYIQIPVRIDDISYAKKNNEGIFVDQATPDIDTVAFKLVLAAIQVGAGNGMRSLAYTFSTGDRIRILYGTEVSFDAEILGQNGFAIYIERGGASQILPGGTVVEIYTPRLQKEENIFYEFGQVYDVLSGGFHAGNTQNQTGLQPAIIDINDFGAYTRVRDLRGINLSFVAQDMNVFDDFPSRYSSIGRPMVWAKIDGISNETLRKTFRPNTIRASNTYVENGLINGLSYFEPLNQSTLPQSEGPINFMFSDGNFLVTLTANTARYNLIAEAFMKGIDGSDEIVVVNDQLFGGNRIILNNGNCGTMHPQTVGRHNGQIFWWDQVNGRFQLYLSYQAVRDLTRESKYVTACRELQSALAGSTFVNGCSVYDTNKDEMVFHLIGKTGSTVNISRTFRYSIAKQGFIGRYTFAPESMASIENMLFSMVGGNFYRHDNPVRMNFYGTQYKMKVKCVANNQAMLIQVFDAIAVKANQAPDLPSIDTEEGQNSLLAKTDFERIEGNQYFAPFLFDRNTPNMNAVQGLNNGDELRSNYLVLTIEFDQTNQVKLVGAVVESTLSMLT